MQMSDRPLTLCIIGASLDSGNRGVSALASSLIKAIIMSRPDANIMMLISSKSAKPQFVQVADKLVKIHVANYRLSFKASIQENIFWVFFISCLQRIVPFAKIQKKIIRTNPILKILASSDMVGDIHGGDSFSDIYGLGRFLTGSILRIVVMCMKKKLILLPQTYGPYTSEIAKRVARFIMNYSSYILSRDTVGLDVVKEILNGNANNKPLHFCPDVAFLLDSNRPDTINFQPQFRCNSNHPIIGLNINGLMYNGGYTRHNMFGLKFDYKHFVHQLVKKLMEKSDIQLLLIPHTFSPTGNINSDTEACQQVWKAVPSAHKDMVHFLEGEYNQYEIKGIIGLCDFFIGSRMHACIAASSQGIPTVGVAYSQKFLGVFKSVGIGEMVIDARTVEEETAIEEIIINFRNREQIRLILNEKINTAKLKIQKTFGEILNP